jgi:hypothetical protein
MLLWPVPRPGTAMTTAPTKPTASPTRVAEDGRRPAIAAATTATKSGVAPFNIPVSADDTCCSASANIVSGTAIHTTPSATVPRISLAGTARRAAGKSDSTAKPIAMRRNASP